MRRVVLSLGLGMILLLCLARPAAAFTDVTEATPYGPAIMALEQRGLVQGFGDGTFRPNDIIKRAQYAKMIGLLLDLRPTESDKSPFIDLGPDDPGNLYPHQYIAIAYANHLTFGTSFDPPRFSPWNNLTRYQSMRMLIRGIGELRPGTFPALPDWVFAWPDGFLFNADDDENPFFAVEAHYYGLVEGLPVIVQWDERRVDSNLGYQQTTRGEVAQLFYNAFTYVQ